MALSFVVLTGILTGSYPAFYLSSFRPMKVLNGIMQNGHALATPRKILVVVQFVFSIFLINFTLINYTVVKNELINAGIAEAVSQCNAPITSIDAVTISRQ